MKWIGSTGKHAQYVKMPMEVLATAQKTLGEQPVLLLRNNKNKTDLYHYGSFDTNNKVASCFPV